MDAVSRSLEQLQHRHHRPLSDPPGRYRHHGVEETMRALDDLVSQRMRPLCRRFQLGSVADRHESQWHRRPARLSADRNQPGLLRPCRRDPGTGELVPLMADQQIGCLGVVPALRRLSGRQVHAGRRSRRGGGSAAPPSTVRRLSKDKSRPDRGGERPIAKAHGVSVARQWRAGRCGPSRSSLPPSSAPRPWRN